MEPNISAAWCSDHAQDLRIHRYFSQAKRKASEPSNGTALVELWNLSE
jgi:hypothetical protein